MGMLPDDYTRAFTAVRGISLESLGALANFVAIAQQKGDIPPDLSSEDLMPSFVEAFQGVVAEQVEKKNAPVAIVLNRDCNLTPIPFRPGIGTMDDHIHVLNCAPDHLARNDAMARLSAYGIPMFGVSTDHGHAVITSKKLVRNALARLREPTSAYDVAPVDPANPLLVTINIHDRARVVPERSEEKGKFFSSIASETDRFVAALYAYGYTQIQIENGAEITRFFGPAASGPASPAPGR